MLLNGVHLLPDASGALVWPQRQLLAVADPIAATDGRTAPQLAATTLRRLEEVIRQRRPRTVVWLGTALPALAESGALPSGDVTRLTRLRGGCDWIWVENSWTAAPLTFRRAPAAGGTAGEIIAQPHPLARHDGAVWPAFVIDGRRLALPAFGPRAIGVDALSPEFRSLFRRPFQALMLTPGHIVTRPRAKLETAA